MGFDSVCPWALVDRTSHLVISEISGFPLVILFYFILFLNVFVCSFLKEIYLFIFGCFGSLLLHAGFL